MGVFTQDTLRCGAVYCGTLRCGIVRHVASFLPHTARHRTATQRTAPGVNEPLRRVSDAGATDRRSLGQDVVAAATADVSDQRPPRTGSAAVRRYGRLAVDDRRRLPPECRRRGHRLGTACPPSHRARRSTNTGQISRHEEH